VAKATHGRFPHLRRVGCDIRRAYGLKKASGQDTDGADQSTGWKDMFRMIGGEGGVHFEYDLKWECSPCSHKTYHYSEGYVCHRGDHVLEDFDFDSFLHDNDNDNDNGFDFTGS